MNSISLANKSSQYDLIWVDGAHGYPVVTIDLVNAYRLSRVGGWVLMDDVHTEVDASDETYKSIASYQTLVSFKSAGLISEFFLVPKRLGMKYNLDWKTKYVGAFRR